MGWRIGPRLERGGGAVGRRTVPVSRAGNFNEWSQGVNNRAWPSLFWMSARAALERTLASDVSGDRPEVISPVNRGTGRHGSPAVVFMERCTLFPGQFQGKIRRIRKIIGIITFDNLNYYVRFNQARGPLTSANETFSTVRELSRATRLPAESPAFEPCLWNHIRSKP